VSLAHSDYSFRQPHVPSCLQSRGTCAVCSSLRVTGHPTIVLGVGVSLVLVICLLFPVLRWRQDRRPRALPAGGTGRRRAKAGRHSEDAALA